MSQVISPTGVAVALGITDSELVHVCARKMPLTPAQMETTFARLMPLTM